MRALLVCVVVAGCGGAEGPRAVPQKRPNTELIGGDYERRPAGPVIRFGADGTFRIAKTRPELDRSPYLADGTFKLEGDQLQLHADHGMCEGGEADGTYQVVISKIGIRFTKVTDDCAGRSRMDGQTFWRLE
jgi:hypothetical protein